MKKSSIIFNLGSLVILTLSLSACNSTITSPTNNIGTSNSNNASNTTTDTKVASLSSEDSLAFASIYENEGLFSDSESVANQKSTFNTKGLIDSTVDLNTNVTTNLNQVTNIVSDTIKADIDVSADILTSLGRSNFTIKTSNVLSTKTTEGETKNTLAIEFTNKETGKIKTDTISKTYLKTDAVQIDHTLTVSFNNYKKTAVRKKTTLKGQVNVETTSKTTLSSGTTIDITEIRNKSNGVEGSGRITIKKINEDKPKIYNFTSNVDASGKLNITAKDEAQNVEVKLTEKTKAQATAVVTTKTESKSSDLNTEISSDTSISTSSNK